MASLHRYLLDDRLSYLRSQTACWCLLFCALPIAIFYHAPYVDLVSIWYGNSTYNYAFLIPITSLYLVYLRLPALKNIPIIPSITGVIYSLPFALLWLIADAGSISFGYHVAAIGLLQGLLLTVLGWRMFWALFFPINYLWLCVPTWQFLVAPLQQVATVITAELIELSGVPFYLDGLLIEVSSGLYKIAVECSGLNFLLAAFALSLVFSNIFYSGWLKQLWAVVFSLALAVALNGVRIASIILFNHYGGYNIGIAGDHVTWGWGLFSIAMLITIFWALRYRDDLKENDDDTGLPPTSPDESGYSPRYKKLAFVGICYLCVLTLPVGYMKYLDINEINDAVLAFQLPSQFAQYNAVEAPVVWEPSFSNAHGDDLKTYEYQSDTLDMYVAYYGWQNNRHEIISHKNNFIGKGYKQISPNRLRKMEIGNQQVFVIERMLAKGDDKRLVWAWFWADNQFLYSKFLMKLLQVKTKLLHGNNKVAAIAISTEVSIDDNVARQALKKFLFQISTVRSTLENTQYAQH